MTVPAALRAPWIVGLLALAACYSPRAPATAGAEQPERLAAREVPRTTALTDLVPSGRGTGAALDLGPLPEPRVGARGERLVVFDGTLVLQVADVKAAESAIDALTKEVGGWVHRIEGRRFTLRVPAARFHETMDRLGDVGQVVDRTIIGSDVTEEYRDLELRLANAEKVLARLQALLERATSVEEALAVEREIGRLTEEIERLEGKIDAMRDAIAHSTIVVELNRLLPPGRPARTRFPFPWIEKLGVDELTSFRR
jgi:hypothetical protein